MLTTTVTATTTTARCGTGVAWKGAAHTSATGTADGAASVTALARSGPYGRAAGRAGDLRCANTVGCCATEARRGGATGCLLAAVRNDGRAERGDTAAARTYCQRALDLCSRMQTTVNQARAYDALGNMKSADGNAIGAVDAWQHALTVYQRFGNAAQASAVQAKINEATMSPRRDSAGEGA